MNPKMLLLRAFQMVGLTRAVSSSSWRRSRLLILGYHGVARMDEDVADPQLYISPALLRDRFTRLDNGGYNVLRLGDALGRLQKGNLPPRSIVLTFDDGTQDFAELVVPLLREWGFPATVYVTTYYCDNALPVFDPALRYLLWRGRFSGVDLHRLAGRDPGLRVATAGDRDATWRALYDVAAQRGYSTLQKHELLGKVAECVGVDFAQFVETGLYTQMTPDQIRDLPGDLVDVQLHTHRHRTPRDQGHFASEIEENRQSLLRYRPTEVLEHFCYPSGDYWGEFLPWLREMRVKSATTCVPGLTARTHDPLLLPRFMDTSLTAATVFDSWTSGVAAFLPRRSVYRFDRARMTGAQ